MQAIKWHLKHDMTLSLDTDRRPNHTVDNALRRVDADFYFDGEVKHYWSTSICRSLGMKRHCALRSGKEIYEEVWKLLKVIGLMNYGGIRLCLCTQFGRLPDGSVSYRTRVSHTN